MAKKQFSSWAFLFAGIIIGLFVSFIFYLKEQDVPQNTNQTTISDKFTIKKHEDGTDSKPRFDFYSILPELEVIVPTLEVISNKEDKNSVSDNIPKPTETLEQGESFILQAGSFNEFREADKLKASLALLGLEASIQKVSVDNKTWHRVRLGPFTDRHRLNQIRQQLKENNIAAITLKVSS